MARKAQRGRPQWSNAQRARQINVAGKLPRYNSQKARFCVAFELASDVAVLNGYILIWQASCHATTEKATQSLVYVALELPAL
jgi:hypothetical protein